MGYLYSMKRSLAQRLTAQAVSVIEAAGRQLKIKVDTSRIPYRTADEIAERTDEARSEVYLAAWKLAELGVWLKENPKARENPASAKMAEDVQRAYKALNTAYNKFPFDDDIKKLVEGVNPYKFKEQREGDKKKAISVLVEKIPELIEEYYESYYRSGRRYDEPCIDTGFLRSDIWDNRNWGEDVNSVYTTKDRNSAINSALRILKRQGKVASSEGMGSRGKSAKCYEPPESVMKKLQQKYG